MPKLTALVVIENASPTFDKTYSYTIPESLQTTALPGARVRVPFGRGNKKRTGLIVDCQPAQTELKLKPLAKVLDNPPILNKEGLALLAYLKESTFSTWFDALRLLIPAGLSITPKISFRLGEPAKEALDPEAIHILSYLSKRKSGVREETFYKNTSLTPNSSLLQQLLHKGYVLQSQELSQKILDEKVTMVAVRESDTHHLTPRQEEVLDFLDAEAPLSLKEAAYYTGASPSVFQVLKSKGHIEYYQVIHSRGAYAYADPEISPLPPLSPAQQEAFDQLSLLQKEKNPKPALLFGVTGSGKTQVFLRLVQQVVQQGQTAIVMVPEISLTSQTVVSLQSCFGNKVAVLHSGLTLGERMDEWKRIQSGQAPIVVGTRSAVFAPLNNIGLLVMDEEQERTYKSDQSPRFHTRDVALLRSRYHKALFLMCSATPSVESYYYATQGHYHLFALKERFGEAILPHVFVVDMGKTENTSSSLSFSTTLLEEIYYNLEHKEQSILLLNRRGFSTLVKCSSCGTPAQCPHCSVALTYHSANDSLVCHYCSYIQPPATQCTVCESQFMRYSGMGTQRLEQELGDLFPSARILRMDMDTTMTRGAHEEKFDAFRQQDYDIMIGTQMVAKGLNFPHVTLVGVLSADQSLFASDFRSYERSFSLLTQVVGRSGRGEKPGRAYIQSYDPDHPIIHMASNQDYLSFWGEEIVSRRLHLYPPFCTLAGVGFVGKELEQVEEMALRFTHQLQLLAKTSYPHLPLRVLGPSPGEVVKVAGRYRYKLILKCKKDKNTRDFLREMLQWFYKETSDVSIYIDFYYERI